jgi:RNA polymerase sigma factor (sigma-70 family)
MTTEGFRAPRRRLSGVPPRALRPGGRLAPEHIGEILAAWHPAVIAELGRTRLWTNGAAGELDSAYWEVASALVGRTYGSEAHLRNALFRGLSLRGMAFWRRAMADADREVAASVESLAAIPDERAVDQYQRAERGAELALALEFLSELQPAERDTWTLAHGPGLSQREIAARLGLTLLDVKRHLYHATHKLQRFRVVVEHDRLCARRAEVIAELAAGRADRHEAGIARAHLNRCSSCRERYRSLRKHVTTPQTSLPAARHARPPLA